MDNDFDGLTDCEDAECSDVCSEDCADGKDNDADAYTDCEDDECWGVGDCMSEITVVLQSGRGSLTSDFRAAFTGSPTRNFELGLRSVTGSAFFTRNQASYSCHWAAQNMRVGHISGSTDGAAFVRATSVTSSGGCLDTIDSTTFAMGKLGWYASSSPKGWRPERISVPLRVDDTSVIRASFLSSSQSHTKHLSGSYGFWNAELVLVPGGPWMIGRPQ